MAARRKPSATQAKRVSAKIRHLRAEGVPQKRAVATALSMARAGRITKGGGYKRGGKGKLYKGKGAKAKAARQGRAIRSSEARAGKKRTKGT